MDDPFMRSHDSLVSVLRHYAIMFLLVVAVLAAAWTVVYFLFGDVLSGIRAD